MFYFQHILELQSPISQSAAFIFLFLKMEAMSQMQAYPMLQDLWKI